MEILILGAGNFYDFKRIWLKTYQSLQNGQGEFAIKFAVNIFKWIKYWKNLQYVPKFFTKGSS